MLLWYVKAVGTERVPLEDSAGRILARELRAEDNVPPFDRSPYDGYALRAGDTAVRIRSTSFVDYLVTYNISYAALSAANPGVDLDALTPGRQLCIPPIGSRGSCAEDMGTLELSGDFSAQALAEQLRTTVSALMRSNPTYTPRDFTRGRIICVPPAMS